MERTPRHVFDMFGGSLVSNLCVLIQSIYELGLEATFGAETDSASKIELVYKTTPCHRVRLLNIVKDS